MSDDSDVTEEVLADYANMPDDRLCDDESTTRAMAREILRRRAANRDLEEIQQGYLAEIEATPELKAHLVREMATMRLLSTMVPEFRWDDAAVTRIFEKISPAARAAYDRLIGAEAAREGFRSAFAHHARSRLGFTSERLIAALEEAVRFDADLGKAGEEFQRIVLPEVIALIEQRQRAFDDAKRKESTKDEARPPTPGTVSAPPPVYQSRPVKNLTVLLLGKKIECRAPGSMKIGTLHTCQIRLDEGPGVAWLHAVLEADDDGAVWIMDLGSVIGTRLYGSKISRARIRSGDKIEIGPHALVVTFEAP